VLVKSDLEICLLEALIAAVAKWLATILRRLSSKELELKKIAGGLTQGDSRFRQVQTSPFCEASADMEDRQT